jgi:hypothetical protein
MVSWVIICVKFYFIIIIGDQMSFKTTCPYCGVGCEIKISRSGSTLKLIGDKDSPVNKGMLCIKGQTLLETVGKKFEFGCSKSYKNSLSTSYLDAISK